jgi:hypothetical protein
MIERHTNKKEFISIRKNKKQNESKRKQTMTQQKQKMGIERLK